ncbi:MAG: GatB/YqeY domain-containing protein [Acidobacteriota bacterium]|nr:GatB/YqeY domain-containing protein [Acidobacteriota bacterium]
MKERIRKDLTVALKAGQKERLATLRLLLSQMKNEEISRGKELTSQDVLVLVQRGIKTRRDSVELFERGGRTDLVAREKEQIAILEDYLPLQLNAQELKQAALNIIQELKAETKKDMGRVMKALLERHAGKVDGRQASQTVASLLK